MIAYYSSKSGNTQRFMDKVQLPNFRISRGVGQIGQPFLLVTPTFADPSGRKAVPPCVIDFLNDEANRKFLLGVIGTGNRNFGKFFAQGGKEVASVCKVPLLYTFELSGFDRDVDKVREIHMEMIHATA